MPSDFFEQPILNSPYTYPGRHWELDDDGQPTNNIIASRRRSAFITPVPKPKKRRRADAKKQTEMVFQGHAWNFCTWTNRETRPARTPAVTLQPDLPPWMPKTSKQPKR